jgi:hypothetical protein
MRKSNIPLAEHVLLGAYLKALERLSMKVLSKVSGIRNEPAHEHARTLANIIWDLQHKLEEDLGGTDLTGEAFTAIYDLPISKPFGPRINGPILGKADSRPGPQNRL